jgi:cephalosporin-C deacetylase-like acetyl esterase
VNPYQYSRGEPSFNLRIERTNSDWSRYAVEFSTPYPTPSEEGRIVRGEYFRPLRASNVPVVVLIHGLGDLSVVPCKLLARTLVNKGIACFVLYLVFHSSRMPESVRKRMPALTSDEWFEGYRTSVIELGQVVDWAYSRPEINHEQIGVIGISLGGFISAIAMGIDERLKAGVFIAMGANSEVITWESKADTFRKGPICTRAECREAHTYYPQYLAEVSERGFENVTPFKQCFLTDAMTFAHRLRNRPILMINALWDKYIPRRATLQFWEACGKPSIMWLPGGHASIWAWYPSISRKVTAFLSSNFNL